MHRGTNSPDSCLYICHFVSDRCNLRRRAPSGRYRRTMDMSIVQAGRTAIARGNSRHPLTSNVLLLLFCHVCGAITGFHSIGQTATHCPWVRSAVPSYTYIWELLPSMTLIPLRSLSGTRQPWSTFPYSSQRMTTQAPQ